MGLNSLMMFGSVKNVLQLSRPPIDHDTPLPSRVVCKLSTAKAPFAAVNESPKAATISISPGVNL